MKEETAKEIAQRLSAGLSLDQPDLDLLEISLHKWWNKETALARELFGEVSPLFSEELNRLLAKLSEMELYFAEREEWERCAITRDLRADASKILAHSLLPKRRRRRRK